MALRNLQVGDNLNNATLYFTLDVNNQTQLDNSTGLKSEIPFMTTGGYFFSQGNNSYSLGTRYYSGIYQGDPEESRYLEFPVVDFLYVSWYSSGSHASLESHYTEQVCPADCGTVTEINTSTYFYQYLMIDDSEVHLSSKLYLGNQQISAIYLGETPLPKVMLGNAECKPCFFRVNSSSSPDPFYFELGQTWKQWIDQGTHYDPSEYAWTYDEYGVGWDGGTLYMPSTHDQVSQDDLIIDGLSYEIGRTCLGSETLIKTDKGLKAISALSIGDKLSKNNIVEKIVVHNREKYYIIILENDDVIRASNDHLFISKGKAIKTENLEPGQSLNGLKIKEIRMIKQSLDMYEIKTSTNQYTLFDGVVCECENI